MSFISSEKEAENFLKWLGMTDEELLKRRERLGLSIDPDDKPSLLSALNPPWQTTAEN